MVYYPISALMLGGSGDPSSPHRTTCPGSSGCWRRVGLWSELSYAEQPSPDGWAPLSSARSLSATIVPVCAGRQHLHARASRSAETGSQGCGREQQRHCLRLLGETRNGMAWRSRPEGNVPSIEEKPQQPKSNYAIGALLLPQQGGGGAKSIRPLPKGELEITTVNQHFESGN